MLSSEAPASLLELPLPALSPTMEVGTINSWKKSVGDKVEAGDVVADIQTDKAVVDFECQDEGYLAAILVKEGQEHQVGTTVAIMVEDEQDINQAIEYAKTLGKGGEAAAATPSAAAETAPATGAGAASDYTSSNVLTLLPSTAALLHRNDIDPASVKPTGPKGHILKGDVLNALETGAFRTMSHQDQPQAMPTPANATANATDDVKQAAAPAAPEATPTTPSKAAGAGAARDPSRVVDIPLTNMRKIIASRLTESKQTVPHATSSIKLTLDNILSLRSSMKAQEKKPPSLNDFVIKAAALALRDVPEANCTFDASSGSAELQKDVDISVAVATPDGLITPIIKQANQLRLSEISSTMKDLASRAKDKTLLPDEFQGGSFTISNLGMFGISQFVAVINPPQACILAVGGGQDIMQQEGNTNDVDTLEKKSGMTVTLSSDARCVDQFHASRFLAAFQKYMQDPVTML